MTEFVSSRVRELIHIQNPETSIQIRLYRLLSENPSVDPKLFIEELKSNRQVCQYQFKKNDIVWICRQCQSDETCVLCNECFHNSSHVGHEVYFYHSQAGGCCDCGDYGAWKPEGFCHRHGKIEKNPIISLPERILAISPIIMSEIFSELVQFTKEMSERCQISSIINENIENLPHVNILLHQSDFLTGQQIQSKLISCGLSEKTANDIVSRSSQSGTSIIRTGPFSNLKDFTVELMKSGLWVCVSDSSLQAREARLVECLQWLREIARINDGMCRIICNAIPIPLLCELMNADALQAKTFVKELHQTYMTLMADPVFKTNLAVSYALTYPKLASNYSCGFGFVDCSMFVLSVQFLNRPVFVAEMCSQATLLRHLSATLKDTLFKPFQVLDFLSVPSHDILNSRRYLPIISDYKILYSVPGYSRLFLAQCLDEWLSLLRAYQFLQPQKRYLLSHVENENPKLWFNSFNLYLSLGSLFDLSVKWFSSPLSLVDFPSPFIDGPGSQSLSYLRCVKPTERSSIQSEAFPPLSDHKRLITALLDRPRWWELKEPVPEALLLSTSSALPPQPSALRVLLTVLAECMDWQAEHFSASIPCALDLSFFDTSGSVGFRWYLQEPQEEGVTACRRFSFHLYLHRFLSSCLLECCKYSFHKETLNQFRFLLSEHSSLLCPVQDLSLMGLLWGAEIRAGLWVRNGQQVVDQLTNYNDPPFSKIFKYLDFSLFQSLAELLGAPSSIALLFNRFRITENFIERRFDRTLFQAHPEYEKLVKLVEEALVLITNLATELPLAPVPENDGQAVHPQVLRRAIVHYLASAPAPYTDISNFLHAFCDLSDLSTEALDSIIEAVGELRETQGLVPDVPKYCLRKECWGEYDPCYPYLPQPSHQKAAEFTPKLSSPQALTRPMMASAHPFFDVSRNRLLFVPALLRLERDACLSLARHRALPCATHPLLATLSFPPSETSFTRSLQLMTIRLGLLGCGGESPEEPSAPSLIEMAEIFSQFLLEEESVSSLESQEDPPVPFPSLLRCLSDLLKSFESSPPTDKNIKFWLQWVLDRCAWLGPEIQSQLQQMNPSDQGRKQPSESKKRRAKSNALTNLASSAKMFSEMMEKEGEEDEGENFQESKEAEEGEEIVCAICLIGGDGLGRLAFSQCTSLLHPRKHSSFHLEDPLPSQPSFDLHVSVCGHCMHFDCFDAFFATSVHKAEIQRGMIVNHEKGQYQCPVCTRINNLLVPISNLEGNQERELPSTPSPSPSGWMQNPGLESAIRGSQPPPPPP